MKSSQFRSPLQYQIDFDAPTQNRSRTLKSSHFRPPTQQPNNFNPYTEIKSSSISHTEIKSISMLTLKPSDFRPAYKDHVHFGHPHKNQVNLSLHYKQGIFGPHTKRIQFWSPQKKQVTHTKTKSISIPHTETKLISTSWLQSRQSRSRL